MFERYTEKARRTIFYARFEASQAGTPQITPEHLLLALFREFADLKSSLPSEVISGIRTEITAADGPGKATIETSVDLPVSAKTKSVLAFAAQESENLALNHIGPDHLLIGLLREPSLANDLLIKHGVTLDKAVGWARASKAIQPGPFTAEEEQERRERLLRLIASLPAETLDRAYSLLAQLSHSPPVQFEKPSGIRMFSKTHLDPSESAYESHRLHAGHEFRLLERIRLSGDRRTLHYTAELKGAKDTHDWSVDLDVEE